MKFIDLFAGMGGFHHALRRLGGECVFASELDEELRALYEQNFSDARGRIYGDIRANKQHVPPHDVLCAGFPCQPFSKSGSQAGLNDETRGTLFHEILEILSVHHPHFVILENVGNFERHDQGRTWAIIKEKLRALEYDVRGTEHQSSGGHGLISPHHFGFPHTRERFFIVASKTALPTDPFPRGETSAVPSLNSIVQPRTELTPADSIETRLTAQQIACIELWNEFLTHLPSEIELPSFPIWGDELGATYPFEGPSPWALSRGELQPYVPDAPANASKEELLARLPSYARRVGPEFPGWKKTFIRQNREWFRRIEEYLPAEWINRMRSFPPSLRKLEWNCKGERRDLGDHVLQFRPSGLRVKRYSSTPALVAMTTTQIPILGPERRFLTRVEGLRLQGFPDTHRLPTSRARAFAALGNAVHVGVVQQIAAWLFLGKTIASSSQLNLKIGEVAA